jgi:predicted metal-dependent hydrolase
MTVEYHELYLKGIRLFNEEEFFDSHDVLEELWSEIIGEEKKFYQGLIQAAVALFHFGNENFGGARKLYESSRKKLDMYRPYYLGVDLEKFLADFQFCFAELIDAGDQYPKDIELQDERIPKIELATDQTGE